METNPIHSKDLSHGVPQLFNDILAEITEQVERLENPSQEDEGAVVVEDFDDDGAEGPAQGMDFGDSFAQQYDKIFSDSLVFKDLKDSVLSHENGEDSFLAIREQNSATLARRQTMTAYNRGSPMKKPLALDVSDIKPSPTRMARLKTSGIAGAAQTPHHDSSDYFTRMQQMHDAEYGYGGADDDAKSKKSLISSHSKSLSMTGRKTLSILSPQSNRMGQIKFERAKRDTLGHMLKA